MTVRLDLNSLTATEVAELRDALRTRPGERSPETKAALRASDAAIRELTAFYHGRSRWAVAGEIASALSRYSTSEWVRTKADATCRHRDRKRQLIWIALKMRGGRAPSAWLINNILRG
ncbi:prophage antirepressor-like protein [Bradyrhizobium sp. USDA 4502]